MKEITASRLNIRSKPSTDGIIVGQYNRGDVVRIFEQKNEWLKVEEGWVHGGYTRDKLPIFKGIANISALPIRKIPQAGGRSLGHYNYGNEFDVFAKENGFLMTKEGWVSRKFTKVIKPEFPEPEYEYIVDHIPHSRYRRPGRTFGNYNFSFQGITIHNTANPRSNAIGELGWLTNPNNTRTASWHIAVDDVRAVEAVPLDELAWHAGNFTGNNTTIGIEICEPKHDKAMQNAIHLCGELMRIRGWNLDKLYTHQDWSGKYCPNIILDNQLWGYFKNEVEKLL